MRAAGTLHAAQIIKPSLDLDVPKIETTSPTPA